MAATVAAIPTKWARRNSSERRNTGPPARPTRTTWRDSLIGAAIISVPNADRTDGTSAASELSTVGVFSGHQAKAASSWAAISGAAALEASSAGVPSCSADPRIKAQLARKMRGSSSASSCPTADPEPARASTRAGSRWVSSVPENGRSDSLSRRRWTGRL